ncbi:MAG: PEP/pyruvate-binding domain-containing protein [Verrucomicrobia bacterium]|nr:PEP/pyruvate-binding domain-containing protein [Verrucomicrobiota bacterium]
MADLQNWLARLRELIRNTADFSPSQKAAILEILQTVGFNLHRNLRFRSSTNVEDSEQFSGAGLYDSYSGCLADDLDADRDGPSACDPTEPNERGVFRALRRVFASFYNDLACLERLRHGVDESPVGMAVLVHYSTPDPTELANGVATAAIRRGTQPNERWVDWQLVTQTGALPVTNPEPNALPEDVRASLWGSTDPWPTLARQSSLLPLGATVFAWPAGYVKLVRLLDQAARAYEAEFPAKSELTLNFEYKQVAPDATLEVRQIREVPRLKPAPNRPAWLLNETNRWVVFQGEYGDVFAHHRLKSSWTFQTANLRLTNNPPTNTLYRRLDAELLEANLLSRRGGPISELPDHRHLRDGTDHLDEWTWGTGPAQRRFQLRTSLPSDLAAAPTPLFFLSDGALQLQVTYPTPSPRSGRPDPPTPAWTS